MENKNLLKNKYKNIFSLFVVVIITILARLLPHPPNFTPVGGFFLFSGFYLSGLSAFFIPLSIMFLSDVIIGFHPTMGYVYGTFLLTIFIGKKIKKINSITIFAASSLSSVLFFFITNFGVWFSGSLYQKNIFGLISSYIMAIPFFRNTFLGNILYSFIFFYGYLFAYKNLKRFSWQFTNKKKK